MKAQGAPNPSPGMVRLVHLDSQKYWDIHVLNADAMAREHMQNLQKKPGLQVNMGVQGVEEIPYADLDAEADSLIQRGMQPSPDRTPLTVKFKSGRSMEKVDRQWWEQHAANHITRRKQEPPSVLQMGDGQAVTLTYEAFDSMCKDYMRRRADFISSGWWPELIDPYRDTGQHAKGPKPVDGRPDALGQGVQVLDASKVPPPGAPGAPSAPQEGAGGAPHPFENESLV